MMFISAERPNLEGAGAGRASQGRGRSLLEDGWQLLKDPLSELVLRLWAGKAVSFCLSFLFCGGMLQALCV